MHHQVLIQVAIFFRSGFAAWCALATILLSMTLLVTAMQSPSWLALAGGHPIPTITSVDQTRGHRVGFQHTNITQVDPSYRSIHLTSKYLLTKDMVKRAGSTTQNIKFMSWYWKILWFFCFFAMLALCISVLKHRYRVNQLVRQRTFLENQVMARTAQVAIQQDLVEQHKRALKDSNNALARVRQLEQEHTGDLTRLLAVASHDLRQPMHALNLYLGALTHFDLPAPARPVLGRMRQCAQIMDDMFLALLDISRLDAHAVQPCRERFSIASVLSNIAVEFAPQAAEKGIDFYIEPSLLWVESDPALVEQMLANLVANAVRYTFVGEIVVSCMRHADVVRVNVRDTGIGISSHDQETVFEEFCQVNPNGHGRTEGHGLGLAIVRRLGLLLDVPITLVSALGQGSTFSVDLPLVNHQGSLFLSDSGWLSYDDYLRKKLVVIIDEDQANLDAMQSLLEPAHCIVVTARSGAFAIAKLGIGDRLPDVLICNRLLGLHETGLDVIDALRNEFNKDIAAIILAENDAPECLQDAPERRILILHKPFKPEQLIDMLVELTSDHLNFCAAP